MSIQRYELTLDTELTPEQQAVVAGFDQIRVVCHHKIEYQNYPAQGINALTNYLEELDIDVIENRKI